LDHTKFAKATFSVFLGLRAENKYDTTSEKMFKRIAKELISPKERMNLLKYYAYSVFIVHEDLHTKNLSIIFDGEKVLLAPLYDICSTGFYPNAKGLESHLTINGKTQHIRPNDFKILCKYLNVDFKEFRKEASLIAQAYATVMPKYFEQLRKLGALPYFDKKEKKSRGEMGKTSSVLGEKREFIEVLHQFHKKRVEELRLYGWSQ
jgi:serine/threonine-protein kinase HipA